LISTDSQAAISIASKSASSDVSFVNGASISATSLPLIVTLKLISAPGAAQVFLVILTLSSKIVPFLAV
jgi:hypothetical protein